MVPLRPSSPTVHANARTHTPAHTHRTHVQIKRLQSSASAHEELLQRKRAKDKQLDKVYSKREELERALDAAKKEQAAAAAAITQLESRLDVLRQRNTVLEKMAAAERDARAKADEENRVLDEECRLMASLISGVGNQSSILSSAAASLAASMPVAARQSARQTAEVPGAAAAAQELSPARELLYSPRARLNVAARIGAGHAVTNRLLESLRKDGAAVMDPQTIASIKQAPSPCELEMLRATTQPQQVRQPQQQEEEEDVAQLPLSGPEGIASAFRRFSGGGDSAATGGWSSSRGSRDELLPPAAAASVTAGAPIVLASPTPADWHRLQQQDPEEIECAGESQPPAVASNGGTCTASKAWSTGTASVSASISISARPTVPAVLNSSNIGRSIPEEEGSEVEQRQKGKTPQEVADGDAVSTSLAVQEATANNTPPPRAAAAVAVACNGAEAESTTAADAALSKTSQAVAPLRHQLFSGGRVSTDDLPLRPPVFVPDSSSMPKVAPALEERMRSISPQKQLPPPPAGLALGRRVEVRPAILNTGGPGAGAVPQLAKKQMEIFGVVPMDVAMSLGFDIEAARVAVPKAVSARATAAAAAEQQQQGESSVVLMATVASRPRTSSAGGAALDQQRQQQELVIPRHSPRTSPRQTASNTVPAPDNTQKQLVIPKHSPRTSPRQSTSNLPPSQQQEQQQLLSAVAATAAAAAATADPASNLVIPRHSPRQTASNTPRTSSSPRVSAGGKLPPPPEPLVQALSPRGGANPTAAAAPPPSQQQPASLSAAAANIGARAEAPQPLSASLAVPEAASSSSNNSMLPAAARLLSLESSQSLLSQANIKKLSLTEVLRLSGNGGGPA